MMKALLTASVAVMLLGLGGASAADWEMYNAYGSPVTQASLANTGFAASLSGKIVDGTGYYRRGTVTGGPVGGFPTRN